MLASWIAELQAGADPHSRRTLRPLGPRNGKLVQWQGRPLLNLSSNDYLGLAADADQHHHFYSVLNRDALIQDFGLGASSSRLLTGNHSQVVALEAELAQRYGRERALIFNSGYHANLGILPALCSSRDAVFADRLCHASLLDGIRLSGAKLFRYRHLDLEHAAELLARHRHQFRQAWIVTESVFSMDGDLPDLAAWVALKHRFEAGLYVDEAHAVGVFGPSGLGRCEAEGVMAEVDVLVGTFGKALASLGAFAVGDAVLADYLVNTCRPLIFTTALPPVVLHWTRFIFQQLPALQTQRQHVLALSAQLRAAIAAAGFATRGESQIIPLILGENPDAIQAAEHLQSLGWLVLPIRPPTVPPHTARLRISLTAALTWEDVAGIPAAVRQALER